MNQGSKTTNIGTYLVVGFALFSMLFGAGNLIFPPEIGLTGGTSWWQGYLAYFLADAALGICSVFAMLKVDGNPDRLTGTVGRTGSLIINLACIICIGPLLAIPRNAAVTFEMGAVPLLGIDPEVLASVKNRGISLKFGAGCDENGVPGGVGINMFIPAEGGAVWTSRGWGGITPRNGRLEVTGTGSPDEKDVRCELTHNVLERRHLGEILPGLYREYGGQ